MRTVSYKRQPPLSNYATVFWFYYSNKKIINIVKCNRVVTRYYTRLTIRRSQREFFYSRNYLTSELYNGWLKYYIIKQMKFVSNKLIKLFITITVVKYSVFSTPRETSSKRGM